MEVDGRRPGRAGRRSDWKSGVTGLATGFIPVRVAAGLQVEPRLEKYGSWRRLTAFRGTGRLIPEWRAKKDSKFEMLDDTLRLGIHHAALNVDLTALVDPAGNTNNLSWVMDGRKYWFKRQRVEALDGSVEMLSGAGVVVSLILLTYEGRDATANRIMLNPGYDRACPNHLGAFNTVTEEGWNYFRAVMEFLAARYSGNESGHEEGR